MCRHDLVHKDMPVQALALSSGHRSVATTQKYISRKNLKELPISEGVVAILASRDEVADGQTRLRGWTKGRKRIQPETPSRSRAAAKQKSCIEKCNCVSL